METTKIDMDDASNGKKETEKLNVNNAGMNYSESTADLQNGINVKETGDKKGRRGVARTVAAGVGGAALGGALGGGVAMAAGRGGEEAPESETEIESEPAPSPKPKPAPKPEPAPEANAETSADAGAETNDNVEVLADAAPDTNNNAETNPAAGGETPVADNPGQVASPQPAPAPTPESSPHIEEILVDPDDIDGDHIMNIEGTGTVDIAGTEVNAALVTDEAGNAYYLVDVDGEVNDPNATYDIVVDAETGEIAGLPMDLSVSDAQLMAENGIAYVEPVAGDSNNIAQSEMTADIYDPSQTDAGGELPHEMEPEPAAVAEPEFEPLADASMDDVDVI